jgi:cell division protein FtsQ
VRIVEKTPIAAVPGAGGLAFYDSAGSRLPVAAAVARDVDVPIAAAPDRDLLRALAALRAEAPHVYARVSEARQVRGPRAELVFALAAPGASTGTGGGASPLVVRAGVDVTPSRFADVALVEGDLARRGVRPVELDVRFRDQVVARLP